MPEYLAPGVYVEEVSFRQKTIEGVSTSTAGFIGPTRFGPIFGPPPLLTSFLDFERIYGGLDQLDFEGTVVTNHLAHGVRAFFENGGSRLYVARAFEHTDETPAEWEAHAFDDIGSPPSGLTLRARYPGKAGNFHVTFDFRVGPNIFGIDDGIAGLRGALPGDVVLVASALQPPGTDARLNWLERDFDPVREVDTYRLRTNSDPSEPGASLATDLADVTARVVTVDVTVGGMGRFMSEIFWEGLAPHPTHRQSLVRMFAADPVNRFAALNVPLVVDTDLPNGVEILETLLGPVLVNDPGMPPAGDASELLEQFVTDPSRTIRLQRRLEGGHDGEMPGNASYTGDADAEGNMSGLLAFEELDDISIVAAPGSSMVEADPDESITIQQLLISHCERMRYRIAVLDSPEGALVGGIREYRGGLDSKHAGLYYPWVEIMDPVTEGEIYAPPSGFVAGIYARNDVERGVHKAPANEIVRLAIDFEQRLNKAQQDVLNPEGVNCLRFFQGRGFRVWGARTITSDPEWKYVNLRRYFAFLEHSIDKGTQWAVFEPNGRILWDNLRRTVEDFLFAEWKGGHLLGDKPEEAYFVKCDLTTMTQNDLDNGRLVCLVGVAPLRPAEFVIFRIGQKTLTSRS